MAMDIPGQCEELKSLKAGWFDGHGTAYDPKAVDALRHVLGSFYNLSKPPSIYPNPYGLVSLEWDTERYDITLEVDPATLEGEYHNFDHTVKDSTVRSLDLNQEADRAWLLNDLRSVGLK